MVNEYFLITSVLLLMVNSQNFVVQLWPGAEVQAGHV